MRNFNRKKNQLRQIIIEKNFVENSHGSCLVSYGQTKVICTATFSEEVPTWLKKEKSGWITAEYAMLPTSTSSRNPRESKIGKQSARSIEIQRLIGRSLRTIVDLKKIPGKQFILDCDVLQADGGTRTASITGAFVALSLSINKLLAKKKISKNPIKDFIAGVSCGIVNGEILVDLDYLEDSNAEVDANFVFTKNSGISEIQISGEKNPFPSNSIQKMIISCEKAAKQIFEIQKRIISPVE